MSNATAVAVTANDQPIHEAMWRHTLSGEEYEAIVTMRTMERVFSVLERGDVIGFGWPMIGTPYGQKDRIMARFRAIRDDLIRLRAADSLARASVPAVDKRATRAPSRSTPKKAKTRAAR